MACSLQETEGRVSQGSKIDISGILTYRILGLGSVYVQVISYPHVNLKLRSEAQLATLFPRYGWTGKTRELQWLLNGTTRQHTYVIPMAEKHSKTILIISELPLTDG